MLRRSVVVALLLAVVASVHANGRAPATVGVMFRPGDPDSVYVAATFGLLVSHDGGCTFEWICESNIGYGGTFDPHYAVARDGAIFATTNFGLRVSRDGGCSFTTVSQPILIDALDIAATGDVWIGTADVAGANSVLRSTDNGATFVVRTGPTPMMLWRSVKVAPSNTTVVYIAGEEVDGTQRIAHLLRSDDAGDTWTALPLTGLQFGGFQRVRVRAIDPGNPDVLYLSSEVGANPPNGDRLYRSNDGGQTFIEVAATTWPIRSVVAHGEQVWIATEAGEALRSTDRGLSFSPIPDAPVLGCVGRREDGVLVGCGANWEPDFKAVAVSTDDGTTWTKLWRFVELHGPVVCSDGTPQRDSCDIERWPALQQQFGTTGPTCGVHATDTPRMDPKRGCCDAGGSALPSLVWPGLALVLASRRRRRSRIS